MTTQIINGDNIAEMRKMEENSIDAIITDPPYGLQFMGKDWDKMGMMKKMQDFHYKWGVEALRVAKPGAHLLSFGGTRVHHRMISGLEDAGWEVRDCLMWVYGQGFPKSHNIGKAIDKSEGVERDVIGINPNHRPNSPKDVTKGDFNPNSKGNKTITAPKSIDAIKWDGWGTALKPSWEPIVLCRKPLTKTIAANVLEWGTGGINIDGCRVKTIDNLNGGAYSKGEYDTTDKVYELGLRRKEGCYTQPIGRFPANLIHDGSKEVVELFPYSKSGGLNGIYNNTIMINDRGNRNGNPIHLKTNANEGSAARFFYCAKPSSKEKNGGLDNFEKKCPDIRSDVGKGSWVEKGPAIQSNDHPTVKPIKLLQYLVKLITPPGGVILDLFAGSGSTGLAAREEGFDVIMIEQDKHYCDIINGRLIA